MIFGIIIAAIIIILILWVVSTQRSFVKIDELCQNALSQIGVQQNSRWDALSALADLTKQYSNQEHQTLMDVIGRRRSINGNSSAADASEQENMLTEAMGKIMAISEAYPDLKANTMYTKTMDNVNNYEQNVRISRMTFNDTVTKYNRLLRQIPTCFVAGSMGFSKRDYLETPDKKAEMPSMRR